MDPADTKELPREMSADVAEETKADVEAVKSVEDASYPTTASRELSHTKPSFAADADRGRANPLPSLPYPTSFA